jgi:hypothetical protein
MIYARSPRARRAATGRGQNAMIPHSTAASAVEWLGVWSRPTDRPAQAALALAVGLFALALVPRGPRWLESMADVANVADRSRRRRFLMLASFAAAFLSLGYIAFYLRGGPRAEDAAAYWLQGRALSHGALAWSVPDPTASFRARNLLFAAPDRLSGIFPPGYPLLLAMGFLVGAPMLIGPLLAAALVVATWFLAHEVVDGAGERGHAEAIARLAAGLSVVSAGLRYHTADALPHGAAAVAATMSLACALRARRTGEARFFGAAGVTVGFLVALGPTTAVAVGLAVAGLAVRRRGQGARHVAWASMGALPGLVLLLAANHAATGCAFASPGATYLSTAGGGGFQHGIHALSVLKGLREHLLDIANVEPLALLAAAALFGKPMRRGAVLIAMVIAAHVAFQLPVIAASAGAAPLVAMVPLEHVLIAIGIARLLPRALAPAAVATLAATLAGFALHASHSHAALAVSDIGRPRFEPDALHDANVTHGLLFFEDDAGYELAHEPGVSASHGIEAVRMRGDDHDRLLYDSLGHPSIHRYVARAESASAPGWMPPSGGTDVWRFEAESDWPPFALAGGSAEVIEAADPCVSQGRVLRVIPAVGKEATVTLSLPVPRGPAPPEKRMWRVTPRVLLPAGGGKGELELLTEPGRQRVAEWTWGEDFNERPTCVDLPAQAVELGGERTRAWLIVRALGGAILIDRTTLEGQGEPDH